MDCMTDEMTLADFRNLRLDLRQAVTVDGETTLSWAWFQAMTPVNRDAFERALVRFNHPLAYDASSRFERFRRFVMADA